MNNFLAGFEKRAKEHVESEEHEEHESKKEEHEKEADAPGLMGGTAAGSLATAYGVNKKRKKED
jgi:hypothetical protein